MTAAHRRNQLEQRCDSFSTKVQQPHRTKPAFHVTQYEPVTCVNDPQ